MKEDSKNQINQPSHVKTPITPWPTVEQLAKVAATLSSRQSKPFDPDDLASEAFQLWCACGRKIAASWESATNPKPPEEYTTPFPKPDSYPVALDEFLRLVLPLKRYEDRIKIYKDHLRDFNTPKLTVDQAEKLLAQKRLRMFDENQFEFAAESLLRWLPDYEESKRKKKAANAANARHNPK